MVEVVDGVSDVFLDQVGVDGDGGRGAGACGGDDPGTRVDVRNDNATAATSTTTAVRNETCVTKQRRHRRPCGAVRARFTPLSAAHEQTGENRAAGSPPR